MTQLKSTISTFRVKDAEASAALFTKLGFRCLWEHQGGEGFPLFIEMRRDAVSLFLSEHNGDGPFGVQIYVVVEDAVALHAEFRQTGVAHLSELETQEWGHLVFTLDDLDGNVLRFGSPMKDTP